MIEKNKKERKKNPQKQKQMTPVSEIISVHMFFMLLAYRSWDYLRDFFFQWRCKRKKIMFALLKINTLNKTSLFLENPLSCSTTKGASTATDFLKKFQIKAGKFLWLLDYNLYESPICFS